MGSRMTGVAFQFIFIVFFSINANSAELNVPEKYSAIQEALDAASPGDVVKINTGVYKEVLAFREGVDIVGVDPNKVIVQETVDRGVLLTVSRIMKGSLSGVTFQHVNAETGDNRKYPDLLVIKNSQFIVSNCVFKDGAGCGIVVKEQSNAEISDCRCENNVQYGIVVQKDASATLRSNACSKNAYAGIAFYKNGRGLAEKNTCDENDGSGIFISGRESSATLNENSCAKNGVGLKISLDAKVALVGNVFKENREQGIYAESGAQLKMTKNLCEENNFGMSVYMFGSNAELTENTFRKNKISGFMISWGAHCEAVGNECVGNGRSGVSIGAWRSSAVLRDNKILQNGGNGIVCSVQGTAKSSGNIIRDNKEKGYYIVDEGSDAETNGDVVEGNVQGDIVREQGQPLNRQDWISSDAVGYALSKEKFDLLEELAAGLFKYKPVVRGEDYLVSDFHYGISRGYGESSVNKHDAFAEIIDHWRTARPESALPIWALAAAHLGYAWEARGYGWAREVTKDGWKGFKDHLEKADELLQEAEKKSSQDPCLYSTWIETGMGLGFGDKQMDALVKKGVTVDKNFFLIYKNRLYSLLPKWGGSLEKVDSFINNSCSNPDLTKEESDALYAQLVAQKIEDLQDCTEYVNGLDWPRVEAGFQEILKNYPDDGFFLNRYCFMACAFKEKDRAKELFEKIGENSYSGAWMNDLKNFRAYKRWATGLAEYPMNLSNQQSVSEQEIKRQVAKVRSMAPMLGGVMLFGVLVMIGLIVIKYGHSE